MARLSHLNDPNGCFADAEQEKLDELSKLAHDEGECEGPPECGYCLDEASEQYPVEAYLCGKCGGRREPDSFCKHCD